MANLDPIRKSYSWNFSNPDKDGYNEHLWGTVLNVQEVPTRNYMTKNIEYWPDGNIKWSQRIILATPEGDIKTFTYQRKSNTHMALYGLCNSMEKLIGKTIHVWTEAGQYGQGRPRPFYAELGDPNIAPYEPKDTVPADFMTERVMPDNSVHGGQVQQQTPAPQMAPQGYYAAPQVPQQPMPAPQPQYRQMPQQPMQPMAAPQPQYQQQPMQPQYQQMPQQAPQQPVYYDDDLPF